MKNMPLFPLALAGIAGLIVTLCALFLVQVASPWPYTDMWDGGLGFLIKVTEDFTFGAFFKPHNEHRIVLARVLFFLDERLFGGTNTSLYVWHFAFACAFCVLFAAAIWREISGWSRLILMSFTISLVFSLSQSYNFGRAFQSMFFLAYLAPFATYVAWARFRVTTRAAWAFGALALGIMSALTMANGALALLPLIVYEGLARTRLRWIGILVVVQALVLLLYFWDYHSPGHHPSWSSTLSQPVVFLEYILVFLGSWAGAEAAPIVGGVIVGGTTFWLWRHMRRPEPAKMSQALLLLLMFVIVTAAVTALGRAGFGVETALKSRYTTPSLYALSAAVGLAYLRRTWRQRWLHIFMGLVGVAALGEQATRDFVPHHKEFLKRAATMSIIQGTPDEEAFLKHAYPHHLHEARVADALRLGIGVFGTPPYSQMRDLVGKQIRPLSGERPDQACEGGIAATLELKDGGVRVTGWMKDPAVRHGFATLVAGQDGRILGFGLSSSWKSAPSEPASHPELERFWVYLSPLRQAERPITLQFWEEAASCELTLSIPVEMNSKRTHISG